MLVHSLWLSPGDTDRHFLLSAFLTEIGQREGEERGSGRQGREGFLRRGAAQLPCFVPGGRLCRSKPAQTGPSGQGRSTPFNISTGPSTFWSRRLAQQKSLQMSFSPHGGQENAEEKLPSRGQQPLISPLWGVETSRELQGRGPGAPRSVHFLLGS